MDLTHDRVCFGKLLAVKTDKGGATGRQASKAVTV